MTGGQHSAEFERLVERRRKFTDGLEANKGEINLDIFEDFYPDKAYFVYELLQNTEDAGAMEIAFTLTPDKLVCEHNGRAFTLADVASIIPSAKGRGAHWQRYDLARSLSQRPLRLGG